VINSLPVGDDRFKAVASHHQAQYEEAYALLTEAFPEAIFGNRDMGEIWAYLPGSSAPVPNWDNGLAAMLEREARMPIPSSFSIDWDLSWYRLGRKMAIEAKAKDQAPLDLVLETPPSTDLEWAAYHAGIEAIEGNPALEEVGHNEGVELERPVYQVVPSGGIADAFCVRPHGSAVNAIKHVPLEVAKALRDFLNGEATDPAVAPLAEYILAEHGHLPLPEGRGSEA
jgi:hypothetical protein